MSGGYDFEVIQRSLPYLFKEGMMFTLTLTGLAMAGGIFFGTLLAMMRLSRFPLLGLPAGAYVNLMRSVPLVLVIFWFYFLVPYIGAWIIGALAAGPGRRVPVVRDHVHSVRGGLTTARSCAPASSRFPAARSPPVRPSGSTTGKPWALWCCRRLSAT
jgi:His/Glu/Gln/Arg/opine family amino acid ABC transporter permease subunit